MPEDIQEILKIFIFSSLVTWIFIYIFEIHNPYVEKVQRAENECKRAGGVMLDTRKETLCINKTVLLKESK